MIWPFSSWSTPTVHTVPQLKEVHVGNKLYSPAKDITSHEVALLLPVFMMAYGMSRDQYIKDNNLSRHFVEIGDE